MGLRLAMPSRIRAKTNFPNLEIVADLKEATGEYVLFLDPDLEPLDENWLSAMAEQLSNPRIGAVGARIVSSDDTIESAGLILLPDGSVGSAFAGYPRNFRGANRQLQAVRNYSAVSASCLANAAGNFGSNCFRYRHGIRSTSLGMTAFAAVRVLFESTRTRIANGFDSLCGAAAHFDKGKCERDVSGFTEALAGNVSTRSLL